MLVIEEELQPFALKDERIERRQNVDQLFCRIERRFQRLWLRPMLQLSGPFEHDRQQFFAAHSRLDQSPHGRLARGIQMAGRVEAHDAL